MKKTEVQSTFLELVSKYWFLIVFIGGMIVTWGRFETRINVIESKLSSLEIKQTKTDDIMVQLQGDIREIKTSLLFIKERLSE